MLTLRGIQALALLAVLSNLPRHANAQVSQYFPQWLTCIQNCSPLWSANYDCTQAGQVNLDCLCGSTWLTPLYQGDSCSCDDTESDSQQFQNWLRSDQACGYYAADSTYIAGLTSQTLTPTASSTESTAASTTSSRTSSSRTTNRPASTGATFTTRASSTRPPTSSTSGPSLATNAPNSDSKAFFNNNKKWFIPVVTVGGILVIGAAAFAVLYFCFGCCHRRGYSPANGPGAAAAARKSKRSWFPFVMGRHASQRSKNSQAMSLVDDHEAFHDTTYYGGGGPYPPRHSSTNPNNGGLMPPGQAFITPYQHGAPLAPIDEVRSIAETSPEGQKSPPPLDRTLDDDDENRSAFSFENSVVGQPSSPYSPMNGNNGGGYIGNGPVTTISGPSGPVNGAGIIGAAAPAPTSPNRYEDLSNRRMPDRRVFDAATPPPGNIRTRGPMPQMPPPPINSANNTPGNFGFSGFGGARPEWNSRSIPTPPGSVISSTSGTSATRDGPRFPQAPAPLGHPQFHVRRGDYYEDHR